MLLPVGILLPLQLDNNDNNTNNGDNKPLYKDMDCLKKLKQK